MLWFIKEYFRPADIQYHPAYKLPVSIDTLGDRLFDSHPIRDGNRNLINRRTWTRLIFSTFDFFCLRKMRLSKYNIYSFTSGWVSFVGRLTVYLSPLDYDRTRSEWIEEPRRRRMRHFSYLNLSFKYYGTFFVYWTSNYRTQTLGKRSWTGNWSPVRTPDSRIIIV